MNEKIEKERTKKGIQLGSTKGKHQEEEKKRAVLREVLEERMAKGILKRVLGSTRKKRSLDNADITRIGAILKRLMVNNKVGNLGGHFLFFCFLPFSLCFSSFFFSFFPFFFSFFFAVFTH